MRADGVVHGTTTSGAGGAWSLVAAPALSEGAHTLTAVASNAAGDSAPSAPIAVVVDTILPVVSNPTPASNSSTTNARFQPAEQAGLRPADLRRLTLKWAFGFPDAFVAWSHPTVAGGRVFVGSQNGTVYSLDAKTGCIRWTFGAAGGVRTALTVAPAGGFRLVVYFGDTAANAYALDADTGKRLWVRRVEEHPAARITGSLTFFEGRLYVPVASFEEAQR